MKTMTLRGFYLLFVALVMLSACAYQPTQTTTPVDTRPTLSFEFHDPSMGLYQVYVDNMRVGILDDFRTPEQSVRLEPGMHLIEIRANNDVILQQEKYFGSGDAYTVKVRD